MAQENARRDRRMPEGTLMAILTLVMMVAIGAYIIRSARSQRAQQQVAAATSSPIGRPEARVPIDADPQPTFRTTRDEINNRGADLEPLTRLSYITGGSGVTGHRVELQNVEVVSASGSLLSIKDGNDSAIVIVPDGTAVRAGQHVNVSGRVEAADGSVRIAATRVAASD